MPSRGLNFLSGRLPAFTNGAGITYEIRYTVAGSDEWRTHATGIDASRPFNFSLPQPGNLHYTNIGIFFGNVPSNFGLGNEVVMTFIVGADAPSNVLINRFALRYDNVERPGSSPDRPIVVPDTPENGGNWLSPGEIPAPEQLGEIGIADGQFPLADITDEQLQMRNEQAQNLVVFGYEPQITTDTDTDTSTNRRNPQTGDDFNLMGTILSAAGLVISLGALLILGKYKKKQVTR